MAVIVSQQVNRLLPGGNLVATLVKLTATSDSVEIPRTDGASNRVVQLVRPSDPTVTVSQSDADTVSLTGSIGDLCLLISFSNDPIPNPVGDGA